MALLARERTGKGQRVQVSMLRAASAWQSARIGEFLQSGVLPAPRGSASQATAPDQAFECQDGEWIGVAVTSDAEWAALCDLIGQPELREDERFRSNSARVDHRHELAEILTGVFGARPSDYWAFYLERSGIHFGFPMTWEDTPPAPAGAGECVPGRYRHRGLGDGHDRRRAVAPRPHTGALDPDALPGPPRRGDPGRVGIGGSRAAGACGRRGELVFRPVDRAEVTPMASATAAGSMRRAVAPGPQPAVHAGPSPAPPPVGAVRDLAGRCEQQSPDDRHSHHVAGPCLPFGARE